MDVATMSLEDRLGEAVRRSAKYMPEALAAEVAAIFTPINIAIMAGTLVVWACGVLIMLVPSLWTIIGGLAIAAGCGFITQATSTASVALTAESGRTSAIGLYATCFYVGGGCGAILPGLTWAWGGWPACVAMVIAMQMFMACVVFFAWKK